MSEYQYYEFIAIDHPLSSEQIEQVRAYSSRAEISSTSFTNEYNYGSFKGDPHDFLTRFYDAFVYLANWGTRRFAFRLPADLVDVAALKPYCSTEIVDITKAGEFVLIDIANNPDDGGGEWLEAGGEMASLAPIRAEVMMGDMRALYIGWLQGVSICETDDDRPEPPIPAGLRKLTAAQQALLDFLEVDGDLFEAATALSPDRTSNSADEQGLRNWLGHLPAAEKDDLLFHLVDGQDPALAARIRLKYQRKFAVPSPAAQTGRTIGQLLTEAEERTEIRRKVLAAQRAKEKEERAAKAAVHRAEELRKLSARQPEAWKEVDALIAMRQTAPYEKAVKVLVDLREVAVVSGALASFQQRVIALRKTNIKKGNLIGLMKKAGLLT